MPDQNGIESTRQISDKGDSRVLVLTVHTERQVIASAIGAGAAGYLLKDSLDDELLTAVRKIHEGGSMYSAEVTKTLANITPAEKPVDRNLDLLTAREKEVFYLLAEGRVVG